MSILKLKGICKRFGATLALQDVDLELSRGKVHALIGENGAGKTTLMNVLAGMLRSDQGSMELDGEPYSPRSPLEARRRGLALIHQDLSVFPHLSVAENILMGMEPTQWGWLDRKECRHRAVEVLEGFHHPEIHPDRLVAELPIAARQIVEICRSIVADAKIILMDEPTSSLEQRDVDRLFSLIREMRTRQISVIYISHFLEEIREIADEYTVLRDGFNVAGGQLNCVSNRKLVTEMVGRSVENLFPRHPPSKGGEVILKVNDLTTFASLKGISFEVRRGEILGIAGLIGSGRTELIRTLYGLLPAQSGSCVVGCYRLNVSKAGPFLRISNGLGYVSEDRKGEGLALALSVADNMTLSSLSSCAPWGWLSRTCQHMATEKWMKKLSVKADTPMQPVRTLSGGNQQKIALGRLLHQQADVLLLDEPTRGIDIGSKVQIYEAIACCAMENKAVLIASSYLPELFGLCDRLAVMNRGRLSSARPIEHWTPESVMQAAIAGG